VSTISTNNPTAGSARTWPINKKEKRLNYAGINCNRDEFPDTNPENSNHWKNSGLHNERNTTRRNIKISSKAMIQNGTSYAKWKSI
jgi:hypothetical protein